MELLSRERLYIQSQLMFSNRLPNVSSNQGRFGGVIDLSWLLAPAAVGKGPIGGQRQAGGQSPK